MRIAMLENENLQYLKIYAESCRVTKFQGFIVHYLHSKISAELPEMTKGSLHEKKTEIVWSFAKPGGLRGLKHKRFRYVLTIKITLQCS